MKYSFVLAALVAAVTAQDLSLIPECAHDCIKSGMKEVGCKDEDYACACEKKTELQTEAAPCAIAACGDKIGDVLTGVATFCANLPAEGGSGNEQTTSAAEPTKTETEPEPTTAAPEPTTTADDGEDDDEDETTAAPSGSGSGSVVPPEATESSELPAPTTDAPAPTQPVPGAAAGVAKMGALGMVALGALAAF